MQTAPAPREGKLACILIATDFSDNSRVALDRARELADAHEARLVAVHVLPDVIRPTVGFEGIPVPADLDERAQRDVALALHAWVEPAIQQGLEVEERILRGSPDVQIVELAAQVEADLVVAGTRGHTGFKHLLLGSVAEEIVRQAHCQVLAVHSSDTSPISETKTVVIPTDFSQPVESAVRAARDLLPAGEETRFVLMHAFFPIATTGPALIPAVGPPLVHKELERAVRQKLEEIATPLRAEGLRVDIEARCEDSSSAILECAEVHGAELIAMGTRGLSKIKKLLLGSTTQRVVQHAHCPVLSIPPEAPTS